MRTVIVHYHIFKNAGSTFDSMLEATFGERWANFDKPQAAAYITPDEMAEFILANPDLAAVSSHHAVLPLPEIPGVTILPALFLRHPLDRARSVYDFERRQGIEAGPVSKGAEQAAKLSFAEYLRWRLDATVNGVVANFQTVRLIHDPKFNRHKLTEDDFQLAWRRLRELPFVGLVEDFDLSIQKFSKMIDLFSLNLNLEYQNKNQSQRESKILDRLEKVRLEIGELLWLELISRNSFDSKLYDLAKLNFTSFE